MDEITDEDNLWLNASKMEDEGDNFEAFVHYLEDATECLKQNSSIKTALSCSCAASCLVNIGNLTTARQLYLESARIYEENADSIIAESIRESLWSLQEAYEHYLLGGNDEKAQKIYDKYIFLAKKINPFSGEDEIVKNLRMKKKHADTIMNMSNADLQISAQVEKAMQNFTNLKKSNLNSDKETGRDKTFIISRISQWRLVPH
jgi:tetratricopeptide (TPR) repeat protein